MLEIIDRIEKEAMAITELKRVLKQRAMIYQLDKKEQMAKLHGKPIDSYYDLPYSEWAKIRDVK